MGAKELVMLDEKKSTVKADSNIVVVLSNDCTVEKNILTIPRSRALMIAATILVQADLSDSIS